MRLRRFPENIRRKGVTCHDPGPNCSPASLLARTRAASQMKLRPNRVPVSSITAKTAKSLRAPRTIGRPRYGVEHAIIVDVEPTPARTYVNRDDDRFFVPVRL